MTEAEQKKVSESETAPVVDGMELQCDESGCAWVEKGVGADDITIGSGAALPSLICDVTGCRWDSTEDSSTFQLLSGPGWRLGYDTAPAGDKKYVAMVGSDVWSTPLTATEYNDFTRLLKTLRTSVATLDSFGDWGEDKGEAFLDMKTDSVWMQARCPQERLKPLSKFFKKLDRREPTENTPDAAFDLRFILTSEGKREVEGFLPAVAVLDMLDQMDTTVYEDSVTAASA